MGGRNHAEPCFFGLNATNRPACKEPNQGSTSYLAGKQPSVLLQVAYLNPSLVQDHPPGLTQIPGFLLQRNRRKYLPGWIFTQDIKTGLKHIRCQGEKKRHLSEVQNLLITCTTRTSATELFHLKFIYPVSPRGVQPSQLQQLFVQLLCFKVPIQELLNHLSWPSSLFDLFNIWNKRAGKSSYKKEQDFPAHQINLFSGSSPGLEP